MDFVLSTSGCPTGNRNRLIYIVMPNKLCKVSAYVNINRLVNKEDWKSLKHLLTNVLLLQAASSEWSSGITTRYIYTKPTVLHCKYGSPEFLCFVSRIQILVPQIFFPE